MSGGPIPNQFAPSAAVDVLVLGGGAAGLMCAIEAAKRGRRVLVLERNREIGEKIRISGGGRCNFTNLHATTANYLSDNPRFCTSALARYPPAAFIALVERHHIAYHEKKLGQLFCDESSRQIIDLLRKELAWGGGEIVTGVEVGAVEHNGAFQVQTSAGGYTAPVLVLATGGLSIPKMGATDFGHRIARQFGLAISECAPALVPLLWAPDDLARYQGLAGISASCVVSCKEVAFEENLLFTHRGLSGPAILQISSYWNQGDGISINLLPALPQNWILEQKAAQPQQDLLNALGRHLPRRLAQCLCEVNGCQGPLGAQKDVRLRETEHRLRQWHVTPGGTEGYAKAEVTRGGVHTRELSPKTMEARRLPGLYCVGEVVDITGWLGGYNFQWAWSSGYCAGQAV
jgi:predicted Rossmann fold flavoprotein